MNSNERNLEQEVILWAYQKGLLHPDNSFKQLAKIMEEVGEISRELLQGTRDGLANEIGDSLVTNIILAAQNDLSATDCLRLAVDKIIKRTGKTVNGTFIKD